MNENAVLFVNLGTPESTKSWDIARYLREFLLDHRVLDMPVFLRYLLVYGIVLPFRTPKTQKMYESIWTEQGSPLLFHNMTLMQSVQNNLKNADVYLAMRYQTPSLEKTLEEIRKKSPKKLLIFPLFPQYASATTGTIFQKITDIIQDWEVIPNIEWISEYATQSFYIESMAFIIRQYPLDEYDKILFTFHGLPEKAIRKIKPTSCLQPDCCKSLCMENFFCYRAQSFATAREIAENLKIPQERYLVSFQSRFGKSVWIQPYTECIIKECVQNGCTKLLVVAPSFTTDCLETLYELGIEYRELFFQNGGKQFDLVPSLNAHPVWIEALRKNLQTKIDL